MKSTLVFNLPEDKEELTLALSATHMYYMLCDIDALMRKFRKYDERVKDNAVFAELDSAIIEILADKPDVS